MKYYLVALFDDESYNYIEDVQKRLCRKYRLYKNMPVLHITLEVIDEPKDLKKIYNVIEDIIKPYKKFKVFVNGAICFDSPYKSVNLKVENKGYIVRLARQLNEKLKMSGFKVINNIKDWDLHISLANTNYAVREWDDKEYASACKIVKELGISRTIKIEKFELWKPVNNKNKMVVKSFPLREF